MKTEGDADSAMFYSLLRGTEQPTNAGETKAGENHAAFRQN
jgi:hypothetical protein